MDRRTFLQSSAAVCAASHVAGASEDVESPEKPAERILYVVGVYTGTDVAQPDFLATIDADPSSPQYSRIIHRLPMPNLGDELHHFGWSACGSCKGSDAQHRYLILPGFRSSRIHVVDTIEPTQPRIVHIIEPEEIAAKANLSAPHTVHCLPSGEIMISMLGDAQGEGPGGFLLLSPKFEVLGRWEANAEGMRFNYDFWYQPYHNVMVSSEWAAPNTFRKGFDPADVEAGRFGRRLHFWNWKERTIAQSIDLGDSGWIPLEVRFAHDPQSPHGFVGAALSSTMWHWNQSTTQPGQWTVEKVIAVDPVETEGWPFPVPGLITDLVLSMDDRFLYFSDWLHGDIRQYDVSDPSHPKLVGQVWLGGVIGKPPAREGLVGGPQMLQISQDGKRLFVTSSLYSVWDNQFYPKMKTHGSYLLRLDVDTERGGLTLNPDFHVDFGQEPLGPARAHEIRYPGGDATSDIRMV